MKKLVYLCFIVLISCHKDEIITTNNTLQSDSSLTFGSKERVNSTVYDLQLSGQLTIDLNADGIDDIRLQNTSWHSPGLGAHFNKDIIPLHSNIGVLVNKVSDTIFINHTQTISQNTNNIQVINQRTRSCTRQNKADSIFRISSNSFYVRANKTQSSMHASNQFSSDSLSLVTESYYYSNYTYSVNMDTTFVWQNKTTYGCRAFPNDEVLYIGFKLKESTRIKLGWLKVQLSSPNKFLVLETAIQN